MWLQVLAGTGVVTYYTSAGCFVTAVVTVNAASAAITGTAVVCEGATTTLSGGGAGTWSSQSGAVATVVSATGVVTGVTAGTTNITFTLTSTGCSTTRVVTVYAQPATITGSATVCVGNTTTLASATSGGSWFSATPSVATIATDGTVTGVTTGTSVVSYTLTSGCRNTRVVTVNSTPAAITGSLGYCLGSTGTLSSVTTGQTWSSTNTSAVTINASTGLLSATGLGTSTISYTNSFGCAQTVVVTVSNAATPIGGDNEVCIGAATTLTNATSGGTWISGATSIATILGATGNITGVAAGTVNITYQISAGCFVTRVMTVTASPAIPITGPAMVCVGSAVTLSHATPAGTWISGNPSRASVVSATGVVSGLSAGAFTVSYYTNSGCYRTYNMTVNPVPSLIGGSAVVCEGGTTSLTNSTAGGTWVNDGAFCTIGNTTGIVTGVSAGLGTVSYVITATGCAITKTVTVNQTPTTIAGAGTICVGATATLTSTPAGGMWVSSLIGKASIGMVDGVLRGAAAGTSMISYTSASGCRATTVVTVLAAPTAITGTSSLCIGSTTTLTNATGSLVWSSTDGGVATVSTATATTGLVTGLAVGTSEIRYTATSGCAAVMVVTVTASGAPISGPDVVCIGGAISLVSGTGTWVSSNTSRATVTAAGVVTGFTAGAVTITFRSSATCFVTKVITVNTSPADAITGPAGVCQGSDITLSHPVTGGSWSSSMPYRASVDAVSGVVRGISAGAVTISYQTQPGCFRTYVVTVAPYVFPISGTYVVCEGKTTTLTSALAGGVWSSGTPTVATINSVTGLLTGVSDGITTITYTTVSTGCKTVKDITVNPIPSVITGAGGMCIGGSVTYTATPLGGTWSTSAGIITTINATTGVATGFAAGNAFISYTLPTGCVNRTASAVTVNPLPYPITGNSLLAYGASRTLASYTTTGAVWSSSNPAIATISPVGVVTAGFGDGNTTISYALTGTGCAVTRVVTVNATGTRFASTTADNAEIDLKVFPSPTNGILTVESPVNGTLSVFTIDGKSVDTYNINSTSVTINLPESLSSGIYMCRFEGEDGTTKIFRILCAK